MWADKGIKATKYCEQLSQEKDWTFFVNFSDLKIWWYYIDTIWINIMKKGKTVSIAGSEQK